MPDVPQGRGCRQAMGLGVHGLRCIRRGRGVYATMNLYAAFKRTEAQIIVSIDKWGPHPRLPGRKSRVRPMQARHPVGLLPVLPTG